VTPISYTEHTRAAPVPCPVCHPDGEGRDECSWDDEYWCPGCHQWVCFHSGGGDEDDPGSLPNLCDDCWFALQEERWPAEVLA
jgi:hypothetical protein